MARHLSLNRGTVAKWLTYTQFPERQPRPPRPSALDIYKPYLEQRWQAGTRSARQLWQELRAQGYRGGYSQVAAYVTRLREGTGIPLRGGGDPPTPRLPSVRQLKWLLLRPAAEVTDSEYAVVAEVCRRNTEIGVAYGLALDFATLVRQHQPDHLASWVQIAQASKIPELGSLARGILRDFAAVYRGIEGKYSNGAVEGHVNRLKMLKRQSYGRAKFDLLRLRVLYAR
jgi:transposase